MTLLDRIIQRDDDLEALGPPDPMPSRRLPSNIRQPTIFVASYFERIDQFILRHRHYQKHNADGSLAILPSRYHVGRAILSEGFDQVTDLTLDMIMAALERRVIEKGYDDEQR